MSQEARQQFEDRLSKLAALSKQVYEPMTCPELAAIANEYIDLVLAACTTRQPRRRTKFIRPDTYSAAHALSARVLGEEASKALAETLQPRIREIQTRINNERKALTDTLDKIAPQAIDMIRRRPDTWTLYESMYAGAYGSQTRPEAYAKGRLAITGNILIDTFAVRWRIVDGPGTYRLEVEVEGETDVEIMRRTIPHLSLKEFVRQCWKRGLQPRVYNPYIPPDFEEKNGLDYFGGTK